MSNFIGTLEGITGMLIALRPISLKVSAAGSIAGIVIFLTTLSFLVTTPGVLAPDSPAGGFLNETQRMDDDAIHAADDPEGYEKAAPGTTRTLRLSPR